MKKVVSLLILVPTLSFAAINPDRGFRDVCDTQCHANAVYVDPAGDDTTGNGAPSTPLLTIAAGVDKLGDQSSLNSSVYIDTVCVNNGSYTEEVTIGEIDGSGVASGYYQVDATHRAKFATTTQRDNISSSNTAVVNGGFLLDGTSNIAITGFAITDSDGQAVRVEGPADTSGDPSTNVYIKSNYIYDTYGSGIAVWGADWEDNPGNFDNIDGVLIRDNYLHNVIDGGSNEKIHAAAGVNDIWVYKNTLLDDTNLDTSNGGECIDYKDGVTNGYIVQNDLTECGKHTTGSNRTGIYVDGGRTAWNNTNGFVSQTDTCNVTGSNDNTAACAVDDQGDTDPANDVLNWSLDAVAYTGPIYIYNNRVRDNTGNSISVTTEGFGSVGTVDIYNNTVEDGLGGGIVADDHARGDTAQALCASYSTPFTCGDVTTVNMYNNTVSGTPQTKSYHASYMHKGQAGGVLRANISANIPSTGCTGCKHRSGSSATMSENVCDDTYTDSTFCASSESVSTMNLDSELKPSTSSAAVNRTGLTVYPSKDIDGNTRPDASTYADAGAHEQ